MRGKLLLAILDCLVVLVGAVIQGSPYVPVATMTTEIEEIWNIEDTHTESEVPLVTVLENNGTALVYEREENTFYCTLGLDNGEAWPQLHLTAPQDEGVSLQFVDDYSYDACRDAIRNGYRYQLMAYTESEYSYFDVVFTGLPIISIECENALLPHEDVPVHMTMSWDDQRVVQANGRAHKRGDTSLRMYKKNSIKMKFTRGTNGRHRVQTELPFFGATDSMILLACAVDYQMIRDRLSWDMYSAIVDDGEPFGKMKSHYAELFVNGEYQGVYLMMKPYCYETEMAKLRADAPATDSYYRMVGRSTFEFDRPVLQDHRKIYYEQHYAPAGMPPFDSLQPYLELIKEPNNKKYSQMVMRYLDIDSVVRYMLYIHACGLTDNDVNNINIWAHWSGSHFTYYFNPWDLDVSWGLDDQENAEATYAVELFDRMVGLDCGGVVRDKVKETWKLMRERAFNEANIQKLMTRYNLELNESGAYYRDAVKWNKRNESLEMYNIYAYAMQRFDMLDRRIAEVTDETKRDRYLDFDLYGTQDLGALEEIMKQDAEIRNTVY